MTPWSPFVRTYDSPTLHYTSIPSQNTEKHRFCFCILLFTHDSLSRNHNFPIILPISIPCSVFSRSC